MRDLNVATVENTDDFREWLNKYFKSKKTEVIYTSKTGKKLTEKQLVAKYERAYKTKLKVIKNE